MIDNTRQTLLVTTLAGATVAVFNDIFRDMAKELRRFAGTDFDKRIDALETRALNSIGGAAFDSVPEEDQRFLAEQMRRIIGAAFNDARAAAVAIIPKRHQWARTSSGAAPYGRFPPLHGFLAAARTRQYRRGSPQPGPPPGPDTKRERSCASITIGMPIST